jgi:hypothetical protein
MRTERWSLRNQEVTMTRKSLLAVCLLALAGLAVAPEMASARWNRGDCATAVQQNLGNAYMPRGEIRAAIQRCVVDGPDAILGQPSEYQYYGQDGQYGTPYGPGYIPGPR